LKKTLIFEKNKRHTTFNFAGNLLMVNVMLKYRKQQQLTGRVSHSIQFNTKSMPKGNHILPS
jgi:hypothetical protein